MTVTILNNPETQLPGTQPGPVERSVSVTSCKPLVFPDILFGRRLLAAQLQSQDFALIAFPIRQRDSINVLLDLTNENVGVSRRNAADGLLGIEEQFAVARPALGSSSTTSRSPSHRREITSVAPMLMCKFEPIRHGPSDSAVNRSNLCSKGATSRTV